MSGLEVVGLILGIYPIIQGTLDVFRGTRRGRLQRRLEVEKIIFQEFVHNLLASELPERDLARLRDEELSNLEIWKNRDLFLKVTRRLGPKSDIVLSTLHDVHELLSVLSKEVESYRTNLTTASRFHKLKHSLPKPSFKMRLDELTIHNNNLQRLFCDRAVRFPISPTSNVEQHTRYLRRDYSHAVDLYHALCSKFQCNCRHPHPANLCIYRLTDNTSGYEVASTAADYGQFEILFSSEEEEFDDNSSIYTAWSSLSLPERHKDMSTVRSRRRLSSISIREYPDSESLEAQYAIEDLCTFVKGLEGNSTVAKASLDFWGSQEKKYLVSMIPSTPNASAKPPVVLCVHDLLDANELPLSREDRMGLALRLSHAVLQFYSTPWIDENWTWKTFPFAKRADTAEQKFDTSRLYVARNFYGRRTSNTGSSPVSVICPEPILTRLGFALIELALGARFADLRTRGLAELSGLKQDNLHNGVLSTEILDRMTAKLLLNSGAIKREEGLAYEDAVRACLDHQYIHGSTLRGLKSNTASFLDDVEECILEPLYGIWNRSWERVEGTILPIF